MSEIVATYTVLDDAVRRLKKDMLETCQRDRTRLLIEHPFTASLAMQLQIVPVLDDRMKTACTDGLHVFVNIEFMSHLNEQNRLFVLAHEVWHCAAGHLGRRSGRDMPRWNLACDHEVNNLLIEDGFQAPERAVWFSACQGFSAEQVYQWLLENPCDLDDHLLFDCHDLDELIEQPALRIDPDFAPVPVSADIEALWQKRTVQTAQDFYGHDQMPGGLGLLVRRWLPAQLDWRALLRQFVQRSHGENRNWSHPSRRHLYRGLYLPGMSGAKLKVLLALDTSGSTEGYLPQFLSELAGLLRSFDQVQVTVVQCDADIQQIDNFSSQELQKLSMLRVHGFGGTDLRPPFSFAEIEQWSCMIYLTDGHGIAPLAPPSCPMLWVLSEHGIRPCDWGQAVWIKGKD
ncbi:VWA-like domain-containing protein [Pseudomonas mendocina]|nr:VWA-like domain-containing protein [Pseudomonas mendocina]MDV5861237.1 VWA-like domain-containing protein [Pseudomonas mendocina]